MPDYPNTVTESLDNNIKYRRGVVKALKKMGFAPFIVSAMASHGRGLICLTLTRGRCEQLALPLMVQANSSLHSTNTSGDAAPTPNTGLQCTGQGS